MRAGGAVMRLKIRDAVAGNFGFDKSTDWPIRNCTSPRPR